MPWSDPRLGALRKIEKRSVAGGRVALVTERDEWGVMVDLEGVEWKINWHADERSARKEFCSYVSE